MVEEFFKTGMTSDEQMASMLRYNAREARVFDKSNDTVVVTRSLLLSAAECVEALFADRSLWRTAAKSHDHDQAPEEIRAEERERIAKMIEDRYYDPTGAIAAAIRAG